MWICEACEKLAAIHRSWCVWWCVAWWCCCCLAQFVLYTVVTIAEIHVVQVGLQNGALAVFDSSRCASHASRILRL